MWILVYVKTIGKGKENRRSDGKDAVEAIYGRTRFDSLAVGPRMLESFLIIYTEYNDGTMI